MFKSTPLVGISEVKSAISSIQDTWYDAETDAIEPAAIKRDLFELIGICKGLMMALDSHVMRADAKAEEDQ